MHESTKPGLDEAWIRANAEKPSRDALSDLRKVGKLHPEIENVLQTHANQVSDEAFREAAKNVGAATPENINLTAQFYIKKVSKWMEDPDAGDASGLRDILYWYNQLSPGQQYGVDGNKSDDLNGQSESYVQHFQGWTRENLHQLIEAIIKGVGGKKALLETIRETTEEVGVPNSDVIEKEF